MIADEHCRREALDWMILLQDTGLINQALAALGRAELEKLGNIVKTIGIKPE